MRNNIDRQDGLLKLSEELAELQQVVSKFNIVWPHLDYYDGTNLKVRLTEEMGDVLATMEYVAEKLDLYQGAIRGRAADKLALYKKWERENDL